MNFNPRTHEGCDCDVNNKKVRQVPISIHAPTRGATLVTGVLVPVLKHFNPRTHEGCDTDPSHRFATDKDFNPRTHEGCDLLLFLGQNVMTLISIHAPTRGATQ